MAARSFSEFCGDVWSAARGLNRAQRRATMSRRYEAAGGGRRWANNPSFGPASSEAAQGGPALLGRARHAVANNPTAANAVAVYESALIGPGIEAKSAHPEPATRALIGAAFKTWTASADADNLTDWFGLQAAVVRALVQDGEAFLHIINTPAGPRLRQLPREMVDESKSDGNRLLSGKQFAEDGTLLGYFVFPELPSSLNGHVQSVFVPASEILQIFRPIGPGAVRGVPWFAPVLMALNELDQWSDAQLVSAKVQAMLVGFIHDEMGSAAFPLDGSQDGSLLTASLEPATLQRLGPGQKVTFSTPQQMLSAMEFGQFILRLIAAGLQIPEHRLSGDMRQVNYSSARTAEIAFRQRIEQIQFHTLIPQLIRPVWERVVTWLVLSGQIDAADFEANSAAWLSADFYPAAQMWVDPKKDAEAEALMVEKGFKSRRQVVAALGFDIEQVDAERAADREREESLGLGAQAVEADDDGAGDSNA